jgi:PAS domain S-box-containing protein
LALKNAGQNRKFGIELVGNIPWGTHLCQFYQTKQDLIDILVPYFAQGLHSNEYCIWVTSPPLESDQAKKALRKAVPDLDDYVAKGQIESISYGDWYFQGGKFVGAQVLKAWIEKEAAALKAGFKGLRISGNTLWEEKLWPSFIDYEEAINSILRQRKILALCTYSLSKCNGSEVIDVIRNHVGTLIKQDKKWGLIEEMAERKKTEEALSRLNRHLRAISNSNQALMKASDQPKFIQEVYNIIVHDCGYELVWVGLAKDDEQKSVVPVAYAGFDEGYIRALNVTWSADSERGHGPTGTAIRMGKRYVCKDMTRDATFKPWLKQATDRGYKSCAVLPLVDFDGKTFGVLSIYSSELDSFSEEELKLLTELANDFAYGLTTLKLRQEKQYAEELTRKQASLIDLCPDAIIVKKMNGEITFWSEGAEKLYGWTKQEAIGQKTQTMLRTKFPASKENLLEELKRTGNWTGELVHRTKDGQKRVVQSYWRTTVNNRGVAEEIMETNVDVTDRKEMQNKLEEYTAHLEKLVDDRTQQLKDTERLTAIGETAGMVGHDLRNPLQTITGEIYLAKAELA